MVLNYGCGCSSGCWECWDYHHCKRYNVYYNYCGVNIYGIIEIHLKMVIVKGFSLHFEKIKIYGSKFFIL